MIIGIGCRKRCSALAAVADGDVEAVVARGGAVAVAGDVPPYPAVVCARCHRSQAGSNATDGVGHRAGPSSTH